MAAIRVETRDDEAAVDDVVRRAFATQAEVVDLVRAIRASPEYAPDLALVSTKHGTVTGFVLASYAHVVEDAARRHRVLTLSPLAVAPEHQRQGIGSALVRSLVAAADARGEPVLVLEGDPRYYGRFGFEHSVQHGIAIALPDWAPAEAAQVRLLAGWDPAIRGTLEYPPAFNVLAAH
jgi:putative acetyltransferase